VEFVPDEEEFRMKKVQGQRPFWWRRSITSSIASLSRPSGLIPASRRESSPAARRSARTLDTQNAATDCQ